MDIYEGIKASFTNRFDLYGTEMRLPDFTGLAASQIGNEIITYWKDAFGAAAAGGPQLAVTLTEGEGEYCLSCGDHAFYIEKQKDRATVIGTAAWLIFAEAYGLGQVETMADPDYFVRWDSYHRAVQEALSILQGEYNHHMGNGTLPEPQANDLRSCIQNAADKIAGMAPAFSKSPMPVDGYAAGSFETELTAFCSEMCSLPAAAEQIDRAAADICRILTRNGTPFLAAWTAVESLAEIAGVRRVPAKPGQDNISGSREDAAQYDPAWDAYARVYIERQVVNQLTTRLWDGNLGEQLNMAYKAFQGISALIGQRALLGQADAAAHIEWTSISAPVHYVTNQVTTTSWKPEDFERVDYSKQKINDNTVFIVPENLKNRVDMYPSIKISSTGNVKTIKVMNQTCFWVINCYRRGHDHG